MTPEQEVIQMELSLDECNKQKELSEALSRLEANPDFIKVIIEGYCKETAVRLVQLLGDPSQQTKEQQNYLKRQVDAVAFFTGHMRFIRAAGVQATEAIKTTEEELRILEEEQATDER